MKQIDLKKLWQTVTLNPNRLNSRVHGPEHWTRVERNGLYLCKQNSADTDVIKLFALFHDSMRLNDGWDADRLDLRRVGIR
ncbi:MAG: hypothetical protein IMF12_02710, partial [Proteobacteria bacterium]|nr:hypothetical protein [Pseudomonadota bacterium]